MEVKYGGQRWRTKRACGPPGQSSRTHAGSRGAVQAFGIASPVMTKEVTVEDSRDASPVMTKEVTGGGSRSARHSAMRNVRLPRPVRRIYAKTAASAGRPVFPVAWRLWPGQCRGFCATLPAWRHTWPPHCRSGPTKGAPWPGRHRAGA